MERKFNYSAVAASSWQAGRHRIYVKCGFWFRWKKKIRKSTLIMSWSSWGIFYALRKAALFFSLTSFLAVVVVLLLLEKTTFTLCQHFVIFQLLRLFFFYTAWSSEIFKLKLFFFLSFSSSNDNIGEKVRLIKFLLSYDSIFASLSSSFSSLFTFYFFVVIKCDSWA